IPSGYPSECDLRATADGLIVRANVAATVPLIHLAVDVVQHEAHVVVHIPVQAERDVLLPTAEDILVVEVDNAVARGHLRSEEHKSELQSLMRISYAVFR